MSTRTINLLPKEEIKRDVRSIFLNIFMIIVIILFLAVLLLTVLIFGIDDQLTNRLGEYESANIKTQDQVNKLRVYNEFKKELTAKQDLIGQLKKDEIIWSEIIYDIGKFMPEGAHLKTFEGQGGLLYTYIDEYKEGEAEEGKPIVSFTVNGETAEYRDILRLVIELKKIKNIDQVWIQNISKTVIQNMDMEVINFTINTYWDLEPFLEGINRNEPSREDEDLLESELEQIQN